MAGLVGLVLLAFTGWLGGELVDRLGVGVDPGAHLDAPSSLTSQPASVTRDRRTSPQAAYSGIDRRAGAALR